MPSKNMLPKGKRRASVKKDYRVARDAANELEQQRHREAERVLFEAAAAEVAEKGGRTRPAKPKRTAVLQDIQALEEAGIAAPLPLPTRTEAAALRLAGTSRKSGSQAAVKHAAVKRLYEGAPKPMGVRRELELLPAELAQGADEQTLTVPEKAQDVRLDQYLAQALPHVSRSRVQLLIDKGQVSVDGRQEKRGYRLQAGERVVVVGQPQPDPLHATPEDIPLDVVYEDADMVAVNKPAGMAVHAGNGPTDDARSGGTLVNALLHRYRDTLSQVGGPLRPGIVHRLDKATSGLILVAKNDRAHNALAAMFHDHTLLKRYIALVHRHVRNDEGTIDLAISRDPVRRTRMTTRKQDSFLTTASHGRESNRHPNERDDEDFSAPGREARDAVSHYRVLERIHSEAGDFTLLQVEIETGRTHQIRVHMQALGHPVVGDTVYGAPGRIKGLAPRTVQVTDPETGAVATEDAPTLNRNFLHAAHLELAHPGTGEPLVLDAPLPPELVALLEEIRAAED